MPRKNGQPRWTVPSSLLVKHAQQRRQNVQHFSASCNKLLTAQANAVRADRIRIEGLRAVEAADQQLLVEQRRAAATAAAEIDAPNANALHDNKKNATAARQPKQNATFDSKRSANAVQQLTQNARVLPSSNRKLHICDGKHKISAQSALDQRPPKGTDRVTSRVATCQRVGSITRAMDVLRDRPKRAPAP
jgi:hypothetical protein